MSTSSRLDHLVVSRKLGAERFRVGDNDIGFDLQSFWRWYASDLVSNATRGCLAEYIVAQAIDANASGVRDEWAACDLRTADGISVEVKSSAFVQRWRQQKLTEPSFGTQETAAWDEQTGSYAKTKQRHADVYVFALLAHTEKSSVDPMNLEQWQFYALPRAVLDARTTCTGSIELEELRDLAGECVSFAELHGAVRIAAQRHRSMRRDPPASTARD